MKDDTNISVKAKHKKWSPDDLTWNISVNAEQRKSMLTFSVNIIFNSEKHER